MRKVVAILMIAGVHWLATLSLALAEFDTGGLGLFPTPGHGVVAGLLKVAEFPLLWILRATVVDVDTLYLPIMILNSLFWGGAVYLGFRLVRRKGKKAVSSAI